MTEKKEPNLDLANGYLLEAAEAAEKLAVVVGYIKEIVAKRVNPPALIGNDIADAVEEFATKMVKAIRCAQNAKEGAGWTKPNRDR